MKFDNSKQFYDYNKLFDFMVLSKYSFLNKYTHLTEDDYEAIVRSLAIKVLADSIITSIITTEHIDREKVEKGLTKLMENKKCTVVQLKDYVDNWNDDEMNQFFDMLSK